MKILALETSTEYCSVALWQGGEVTQRMQNVGQKHSEVLMEMLDDMLKEVDCTIREVDGIAYGAGPGSFTGVRIACGVTQGLALGANVPVVGITTLQAVAEGSGKDKVIVALDARMAEVYFAVFEKREGHWHTVIAPCLCLPQATPAVDGSGWHGAGSGFAAHGEALRARYGAQMTDVDAQCVPQADAIARLAAPQFAQGLGKDAAQALPLYLRDKVALTTREREAL